MATKKRYAPIEINLVWLGSDVMSGSQQIVDYDPNLDDVYFSQG